MEREVACRPIASLRGALRGALACVWLLGVGVGCAVGGNTTADSTSAPTPGSTNATDAGSLATGLPGSGTPGSGTNAGAPVPGLGTLADGTPATDPTQPGGQAGPVTDPTTAPADLSPAGGSDGTDTAGSAGAAPVWDGGAAGDGFVRGGDPTAASAAAEGPHTVQSYSTGFKVGPDFPGGTIWYPTDAEPPFAGIAIVPGFLSPRITIEAWGPFLASHGIVTFTIDTNAVGDQPAQRSRALLNALESLAAENTRTGSPLSGKLDNDRQAVAGWSMGGGGTLIAASSTPRLKAAIGMCSWNPSGSYTRMAVPTLLFASAGDPLAGGQSQRFYTSFPSTTPKMLFEWGLGDHFMANAPTGATGQVARFGLSWLKVFLEGDERYRQFLELQCEGCTDFRKEL